MLPLVVSTDSSKLQRLEEARTDSSSYCRHLLRNIRVGRTRSDTYARTVDISPIRSMTLLQRYSFISVALFRIVLMIWAEAFTILGFWMTVML